MEAECAAATSQLESAKAEAREATAKMSELEIEMKMHRQEAQRQISALRRWRTQVVAMRALLLRRRITHARRRHLALRRAHPVQIPRAKIARLSSARPAHQLCQGELMSRQNREEEVAPRRRKVRNS